MKNIWRDFISAYKGFKQIFQNLELKIDTTNAQIKSYRQKLTNRGEKLMQIVNENPPIKQQSQPLFKPPVRPRISNLDTFSQEKLFQIIESDNSSSAAFQCLTELVRRTLAKNQELVAKVITLEQEISNLQATLNPPKKKCGRKAEEFIINGKTLDDDYLVYLIDNEYFKIRALEKEVGANKNQLRRRYERYKEREEREG